MHAEMHTFGATSFNGNVGHDGINTYMNEHLLMNGKPRYLATALSALTYVKHANFTHMQT